VESHPPKWLGTVEDVRSLQLRKRKRIAQEGHERRGSAQAVKACNRL
jgi:hypothetical protein